MLRPILYFVQLFTLQMPKGKIAHGLSIPEVPQEEESEEAQYEVQSILDRRITTKGPLYLIRWKNYPDPKDFTWQPLKNLEAVKDQIDEFNKQFLEKVKLKNQSQMLQFPKNKKPEQERQKRGMPITSKLESKDKSKTEVIKEVQRKGKLINMNKSMEVKLPNQPKQKRKKNLKIESEQDQINYRQKSRNPISQGLEEDIETQKIAIENAKQKNNEFWKNNQFKLGEIYKHFIDGESLYFNINVVNKNNQICDMVSLSLNQAMKEDKEKLINYLESYFKRTLIKQQIQKLPQTKNFQEYWVSLS